MTLSLNSAMTSYPQRAVIYHQVKAKLLIYSFCEKKSSAIHSLRNSLRNRQLSLLALEFTDYARL